MPDEQKFGALWEAGFRVVPTCATCLHFTRGTRPGWGKCQKIPHDHGKHGEQASTGVPTNGWCPGYELAKQELTDQVGSYERLFSPHSHAE